MKRFPKPLWTPRPLTPQSSNQQRQQQQQAHEENQTIKQRSSGKRCHGNRKLRRFKKKCRRRGMNDREIQQMIRNRSMGTTPQITIRQPMTTVTTDVRNKSTSKEMSKKRKRIKMSMSIASIASRKSTKKSKKKHIRWSITDKKTHFRLPIYLKKAHNVLIQSLRVQLQLKLTNKRQQQFVYNRLLLLDRQQRINQYRNLWRSYLDMGISSHLWPKYIEKRTKKKKMESCVQLVEHHLGVLHQQYDECTNELIKQGAMCPNEFSSLAIVDQQLNEFVQLQQKSFMEKLDARLSRFKDFVRENEYYQIVQRYIETEEQKSTVDQLIKLRDRQLQIFTDYLRLETRISMQCLPKALKHIEKLIQSRGYRPRFRNSSNVQFRQQRYKLIQEAKRACLNLFLRALESRYQHNEHQYEQTLKEFQSKYSTNTKYYMTDHHDHSQSINGNETNLYESFLIYINHRMYRLKRHIYHERIPLFRRKLRYERQRLKRTGHYDKQVHVCPHVILDLRRNPFKPRELAFLARGPGYIRPNQSSLRSMKQRRKQIETECNDILTKIKNALANTIRDGFPPIPKTLSMYKVYEDRLRTCLSEQYLKVLPLRDQLRARRELKCIKTIRRKLRKHKLILRQTDKSGVFHIGHRRDYERKARQYRQTTGAYEELSTNPLNDIYHRVTDLINRLRTQNLIRDKQKTSLLPIQNKTELAYMYFLPKPHKKGTPLRPIVNTIHAATTSISKFLDRSLRPLFDRYVRSTTIVDGVDLLHRLDSYIKDGLMTPSTLFVTFDITNLYTMLPQEQSLEILAEFLQQHHCHQIHGMSIDIIIELARLVLQTNAFVYGKKFYRQIIGGAMGSPFTLTLANIFMWKWERQTILSKLPTRELYGRYIDDVFFTSNENETTIRQWLDSANAFHPNIKLTYTISQCLPFLDVLIENRKGNLHSSVYHKPAAEPTVLSFLSDHPRHVFRNVIQTALMRTIRYSSTFEAFNNERRTIRLTLLYSRYPSMYINEQFRQFFHKYVSTTHSSLLPLMDNEEQFMILRQKVLAQQSLRQVLVDKSAANVDIIIRHQHGQQANKDIIDDKTNKFRRKIFIHSTYESRFQGSQRQIHEIHNSFFKQTDYENIRLIVGHRNNPNIDFELTRKRPSSYLLKNQPPQKKLKAKQSVIKPN